ncbi:coiled-coil alpha-helical rod protein 1-like isoform X2 [Halichondria panicea]|uniref:coiled-coil alpha-helical rod protein 1-like isoform X2 n=1 Tax=Halichondria panicea TaxID=6063 RepID=UPI00312B4B96
MSLHPPSFFSAPRPAAKATTIQAQQQINEPARPPTEDELAALKRENIALKQRLSSTAVSGGVLAPPTSPAILTADLLQVEAHLQSRVRLLEGERNELVRELERGKLLLSEREERHVAEQAEIRLAHKAAISKVQLEKDRLAEEHNSCQEESRMRIDTLQTQLTTSQQECGAQVEELNTGLERLEQANAALTLRLEQETSTHDELTSQLRGQLVASETEKQALSEELNEQIKHLQSELDLRCQRVSELESYLGGEIPVVRGEGLGRGVTWIDERETLFKTLSEQESGLERLTSENKLVNIRLSSLSEILSIQEAEVAKGAGIDGDNKASMVKSLLTRWREKVFVLMLQQKLWQMEESKMSREHEKERLSLLDQIACLERERERLSHTLTDRTAELQLEINKTEDLTKGLDIAHTTIDHLNAQLTDHVTQACHLKAAAQEMAEHFNTHRGVFAQALTRAAGLDQRLTFATRRISSLSASLSCKLAMLHSRTKPSPSATEFGCQTDTTVEPDQTDLSSFSREQLEREVRSLVVERDTLVARLRESTQSFQQQLASLNETSQSRLSVLEGALVEVRQEGASLEEQLSELQTLHGRVDGERHSLGETVEELNAELRRTQATLETRVETAVQKQRQESMSELAEMEALVNVARREHAKAVVQLQQLQRQLDRDKHRAVEAMEMSKAKLEHELEACRKKLHTTQVERNLLMTTLRQEGIVLPGKQLPVQRQSEERVDNDANTQDSPTIIQSPQVTHELAPLRDNILETTDFRTVLKDLQMLSASLLEMDNEETV